MDCGHSPPTSERRQIAKAFLVQAPISLPASSTTSPTSSSLLFSPLKCNVKATLEENNPTNRQRLQHLDQGHQGQDQHLRIEQFQQNQQQENFYLVAGKHQQLTQLEEALAVADRNCIRATETFKNG